MDERRTGVGLQGCAACYMVAVVELMLAPGVHLCASEHSSEGYCTRCFESMLMSPDDELALLLVCAVVLERVRGVLRSLWR